MGTDQVIVGVNQRWGWRRRVMVTGWSPAWCHSGGFATYPSLNAESCTPGLGNVLGYSQSFLGLGTMYFFSRALANKKC